MDKTTERIKADAAHYSNKMESEYSRSVAAYIAGATAERERAQPVIDALEQFISYHETGLLPARHVYEKAVAARKQWKGEGKEWHPISTAPKDGRTIEVSYDAEYKETYLACWSNNPICMLGPRNGSFPPGWATPAEADCDTNLPLDPPLFWREWKGEKEVGDA